MLSYFFYHITFRLLSNLISGEKSHYVRNVVTDVIHKCNVTRKYVSKGEGKGQESIQSIPHLTKDTVLENDKSTRKHHIQENQEVSPLSTGDHKAARSRHHRQQRQTQITKKDQQKKQHFGMVSKTITGGFKLVTRFQPHTLFLCGS